jgi:hypothetical protein
VEHIPLTSTGIDDSTCPFDGLDIVGAVVGGGALIVPCNPIPPLCGFSTCAYAVDATNTISNTLLATIVAPALTNTVYIIVVY